ncbi:MAG: GH92 family glycosyl hydrolase [candidate division KSB1 bacterium]|nr:GH92 family glycosyl hydrolase [candidate division KSB1 bacterium]
MSNLKYSISRIVGGIAIPVILCLLFILCNRPVNDYAAFVNPFIGTGIYSPEGAMGEVNTFPGAALPHGMVQLSPDTGPHIAGYLSTDSTIQGFSHTHLSGTGCLGLGHFGVMPGTGQVTAVDERGYKTAFYKESEQAEPGYYRVILEPDSIEAQVTVTTRAGFHRYRFPNSDSAHVLIDVTHNLADDDPEDATVEIRGENRVDGSLTLPNPFCGGKTAYTLYFSALTSRPFSRCATWKNADIQFDQKREQGRDIGTMLYFDTSQDKEILIKVGISFVSYEQAHLNVTTEIPDWDFTAVRHKARLTWNEKLDKIKVRGGSEDDRIKFYTAVYHALLGPYTASDVNGKYRSMDQQVHTAKDHTYYHVFSLWDTFRSEHALLTLIEPQQQNDMIQSLLDKQQQGGWLPKWGFANRYTNCMIADHAVSVISESYLKGIRDYDTEQAYAAMRKNSTRLPGEGTVTLLSIDDQFELQISPDGRGRIVWNQKTRQNAAEFSWDGRFNDLRWHHLTLTGSEDHHYRLYLDAEIAADIPATVAPHLNGAKFKLGVHRKPNISGEYFTGLIDEWHQYAHALSEKQVQTLYNKTLSGSSLYASFDYEIPRAFRVSGDPEYDQGKSNAALIIDGIDDAIKVETKPAFTIAFWFKTSLPVDYQGRCGLDYVDRPGYIPHDIKWHGWGSVSTTLEGAYNDWCLAQVAQAMGKEKDFHYFMKRAGNYQNLLDPETGFMRPRNKDGSWKSEFDPRDWDGFTEGNSWSYTWFVPHDVGGLIQRMGRETFIQRLDHLFAEHDYPSWHEHFSHYWHGNEPSQQVPYYYTYVGQPWKTQVVVDDIMNHLYGTGPAGIPGNEDVGQLSAWFVLSAMGFHPVAPAQCTYVLGRPLFDRVQIELDKRYYNAKRFEIVAKNNSPANKYIQSVEINGQTWNRTWFDHDVIRNGGSIVLNMASIVNREWGAAPDAAPPFMSENQVKSGVAPRGSGI